MTRRSARLPKFHSRHPDTGTEIAGQILPGWRAAQDEALRLMRLLPFINYVGWDIVLTDAGPVFLEGNNYTGVRLAQEPIPDYLATLRAGAFYEHFEIVQQTERTILRSPFSKLPSDMSVWARRLKSRAKLLYRLVAGSKNL